MRQVALDSAFRGHGGAEDKYPGAGKALVKGMGVIVGPGLVESKGPRDAERPLFSD